MSDSVLKTIGHLIDDKSEKDAIHVAIAPVIAGEKLKPGQRVGLVSSTVVADVEPFVGIVDPYLRDDVEPTQRFWLFLMPGSVTSLKHAWTHPAFAKASVAEYKKRKETDNV